MAEEDVARGIEQAQAIKKEMIELNRAAFDIWGRLAQIQEEAVVRDRMVSSAFLKALDLFFIEAFKSHQSLYLLCVRGHGEDAATIARRLLEISLQVAYLTYEESKREQRGRAFLAYYWHTANEVVTVTGLPTDRLKWWEKQYNAHKKWLKLDKKGNPRKYWFGTSFAELARDLNLHETYRHDYHLLSLIAHCSPFGVLVDRIKGEVRIKSDRLVREILVYGTKYSLWVTANWNERFALIDTAELIGLRDEVVNFDFKRA